MSCTTRIDRFAMGAAGIFARLLATLALATLLVGLSASGAQAAAKFTSYYRGATVWRDANPNRQFDSGENNTATADDGSFTPPSGKGRLYLKDGVHIVTGQPNRLTLAAPRNATGVSAMTSLWQSLLDRKLTDKQIQAKLKVSVVNFKVAKDIAQASDNTRAAIKTDVQVDVLAQFVDALANARYGACRARTNAKSCKAQSGGDQIVEKLADALQPQAQAVLDDQAPVQDILGKTLAGLGVGLDAENLGGTALVAASLNVQADRVVIDERQQEKLNTLFKIIANAGDLLENRDFQNFVLQYVQTNLVEQVDTGKLYLPPPRLSLNPADDTGLDAHDGVTKKNAPGLVAERVAAGAAGVNVYRDGVKAGAAAPVAGQPSVWTFKSGVLIDGSHIFVAKAVREDGGESADSNALLVTVDTLAPPTPSVTSSLSFDIGTPFLQGDWSGDAGDLFKIALDDGNAYVLGDGNLFAAGARWTLSIPKANRLASGAHLLLLSDTDLAGNQSVSPAYTLTIASAPISVNVPNVVGLTQVAAIDALAPAGLSLGAVTQQNSDGVASGLVISQNPAAGSSVASGTAVNVVISSGPAQAAKANVPNLVGLTQTAAANALSGAGLSMGSVTQRNSDTVAAGLVISQNPVAGTFVALGSAVSVTVSAGASQTTKVSVPNVVGLTQSDASSAIGDAGLIVGAVGQQCSLDVSQGVVIGQNPAAGALAARGALVALSVSSGDCGIEPVMVPLPGGSFLMGSPDNEVGRSNAETRHRVTVNAFYIAKYEVTQGQWLAMMGSNPSFFSNCGDDCPVENVSWNDVQDYITRLNQMTGKLYRLPTEAEWEYAARAGTTTSRYWGDNIDSTCIYANVYDITNQQVVPSPSVPNHNCVDGYAFSSPIGRFQPNAFGLYDILGNVYEWTCSDYASPYDGHELVCSTDATARRSTRGGAWDSVEFQVRSAYRDRFDPMFPDRDYPSYKAFNIGFRLAQDLGP